MRNTRSRRSSSAYGRAAGPKKKYRINKKRMAVSVVVISAAALFAGTHIYAMAANHFPGHAVINGVDVSGLTAASAERKIQDDMDQKITVKAGDHTMTFQPAYETDLQEDLGKLIYKAALSPSQRRKMKEGIKISPEIKNGREETVHRMLQADSKRKTAVHPKDASFTYDSVNGVQVVSEKHGTAVDYEKLEKKIRKQRASNPGTTVLSYTTKQSYELPKYHKGDKEVTKAYQQIDRAVTGGLRVSVMKIVNTMPESEVFSMLTFENGKVGFNKHKIRALSEQYAERPYGGTAKVKTSSGVQKLNDYRPCVADKSKSYYDLKTALKDKMMGAKDAEATIHVHRNSKIDPSLTRVDVNISSQTARYYKDGKLKLSTAVVTGKNGHNTPTGIYVINYKATNVNLKGSNDDGSSYSSHVNYWMPFNGGIGLHDATWRSAFGGSIHYQNGSHGCVNMPYSAAGRLFHMVKAGTPVVVHN